MEEFPGWGEPERTSHLCGECCSGPCVKNCGGSQIAAH